MNSTGVLSWFVSEVLH